nr:protein nutcracker [Aedes albopictus]
MEPAYSSGQGGALDTSSSSTSSAPYQIHNLETVAEENEATKKPITDLSVELLVEDSTKSQLSKHLARLLQRFVQRYQQELEISSFDLLFMTVYSVALETGFIPEGHRILYMSSRLQPIFASYDSNVVWLFSGIVPENFYSRSTRSYRLDLHLLGSDERCSLVGIKSGDLLVLTFTTPNRVDIPGRSIILPVARYIPFVNLHKLGLCFQNLKELSLKLKNNIFVPIRDALCQDDDAITYPSLGGLPDEVVALLVKYLDKKTALQLSASCSRFRELMKHYRAQWFA